MARLTLLDSHIHLWPTSAANTSPTGHSWMTPGMPLAKQHLLSNYLSASQNPHPDVSLEGVVYVETDRAYSTPAPGKENDFTSWATGPLAEVSFGRELVEGVHGPEAPELLKGIVLWAPMQLAPGVLREWLRVAAGIAGEETWKRVKGFRFLLQAITDRAAFERLVGSEAFMENLRVLAGEGFVFDVGVDQNSGGSWQLELMAESLERVSQGREKGVEVVLNHFCKPDFGSSEGEEFRRWSKAVARMAERPGTFMKLSGAFSELATEQKKNTQGIAGALMPWVKHVFECFGPGRVMFGSDWPVCNVGGPVGESSWSAWKEVVVALLGDKELSLSEEEKEMVCRGTAKKAYHL
ncbi:hypothetical protein MBLNU230_g5432t1 [Neophaeotheca triangularis]